MIFDKINIFSDIVPPLVIAGPCSAESEEQVMAVASELKDKGITLFRAGVWKPRTRPGCFEGVGQEALQWLRNVKDEFNMPVSTEVATAMHVEQALAAGIDLLWIGARTTANPFAVQEIADALRGVDIPVLIKNPVNPDIDLWMGAFERLYNAGVKRLGAIHRGFSAYGEKFYRNAPQWQLPIEFRRRMGDVVMICDPSHIGGKRELVLLLSQQAMDLNYDGLMIETHCNPVCALSDARQQVTPDELKLILDKLVRRSTDNASADMASYRKRLDEIDDNLMSLLVKRMAVSREIGAVKRERGLTVFQPFRYKETIERYTEYCADNNIDIEAVKGIFEIVHSESIRQQLRIVNDDNK